MPGEDGFHPCAVPRQLGQAVPEVLHHAVERSRDGAELVLAVLDGRSREVAGRIAPGDGGHLADAPRHPGSQHPGHGERDDEARHDGDDDQREDGPDLLLDVGFGRGQPHVRDLGM